MLKTSAKISAPVLGQNTLKLFKCRRFHLSSQSNTKTFAKSSTTLHKSIFSKQKSHNNKRWSSNSNTQGGTGLDIKTVVGHSHSSNDASPQNYDQYFSTESFTNFLAALSAGVLAALVMTLTDSDKNDELQRLAQQLQAIKNKGEGVDAETVSQALKAVCANFRLATQEQQTLFVEFAAQILQHQASPDLAAQAIDILRFALAKGIALPISASELIHKFTTDQFIQEIPVQSALVHLFHRAALNRATRPSVAIPVVVDYAELLMHHSEESVATQATHILLALARSSDYIELLGGTVRSLWVLISRNEREEAVGYAKEALSLINKRQASTTNAQFKHTVETQIMQANIHRKALEHISGYTNNSFVSTILSNVLVTAAGASWGLVRWHTRLARNPSIDTATARKLATARVVPTVVGSLVLYNLANYLRLGVPGKEGDVFEPFVVMLSGAAVTAIAPYSVIPAAAGYARTYSSRRSKFASDHDYQN